MPAARADRGVDGDAVAIGHDRARRAERQATRAAGDAVARMGAEIRAEIDVDRLVERADHGSGLRDEIRERARVARIGAEISGPQVGRRKERRAAGDVDHQVRAGCRAVARITEAQRLARGGRGRGIGVDSQNEGAKMSGGGADPPLEHRETRLARRRDFRTREHQNRQIELIGQGVRDLQRCGVAAEDQRHAGRLERGDPERCGGDGRRRDHRGHLGTAVAGFGGPAGGFADVDEGQRHVGRLGGGDLGEERRLLGAGHGHGIAHGEGGAEAVQVRAAELARGRVAAAAGLRERALVGAHGPLAGTGQDGPGRGHACLSVRDRSGRAVACAAGGRCGRLLAIAFMLQGPLSCWTTTPPRAVSCCRRPTMRIGCRRATRLTRPAGARRPRGPAVWSGTRATEARARGGSTSRWCWSPRPR